MREQEILHLALDQLNQIPKAKALIIDNKTKLLDARVKLRFGSEHIQFNVEIKEELRAIHLHTIQKQAAEHSPFLLVAYRLFPNIKKHLVELGISYLEANGSAFISEGSFYIYLDRKASLPSDKKQANRAFTKAGLKVLFQLLRNRQLLNAPYRTIAEAAGVALGNIPKIMDGLLKTGYIVRKQQGNYTWANYEELLQKWANEYNTTLKPTLVKGRYSLNETISWKKIQLDTISTCWGGEPAADIITNHLRPESFTLYTKENRQQLMLDYHWKPDIQGNLIVYEKFWPGPAENQCAPELLVYADLLGDSNKRNLEAAQIIYSAYLTNL